MQKCYIAEERKKKIHVFSEGDGCWLYDLICNAWSLIDKLKDACFLIWFLKNAVLDTARCAKLRAVNSTSRSSKTRSGVPLCGGERVKQSVILKSHVFFFFLFLGKPAMWLDIPEVFESHQGHQDHEKCQDQPKILLRVRTALGHQD